MTAIETQNQKPGALLPAAVQDDTKALLGSSLSPATLKAYAGHCQRFVSWCQSCGVSSFPASPDVVAGYIASLVKAGRKVATIEQAVAAISSSHDYAGVPGIARSMAVRRALSGARRTLGVAPNRKDAATAPLVLKMIESIAGDSLKAKRDRAILALGFAGAFRRSEIVALEVSDIQDTPEGALVTIRKSKTDQTGEGQTIGIPEGNFIKPLSHVREWLEAAGITEGPIFRRLNRHGHLLGPLSDRSVANTIKTAAHAVGLDASAFSGHSLRSGYITSGAEAGSDALRIAEVSRHKSIEVLRGYVRRSSLLKNHSGASFL